MFRLVTITFAAEMELLRLQARSVRLFCQDLPIDAIEIVINDPAPAELLRFIRAEVAPEYGPFADRLVVTTAADYILQRKDEVLGWRSQQYLKLRAAERAASQYVVLLDAKNHFIRPVTPESFVDAASGRIRSYSEDAAAMNKYLPVALRFYGIPPESVKRSLPCVTPFVVTPALVREMIADAERTSGMDFEVLFLVGNRMLTEFFLLFAWLYKTGQVERHYDASGRSGTITLFTMWPETPEKQAWAFSRASQPDVYCFGLHRARIPRLGEDEKQRINAIWTNAGLFDSTEEAASFMQRLVDSVAA